MGQRNRPGTGGPRIAIIGGGIGGTIAAVWLQRAGYDATIYEQADKIARIGAGINLGPHIMRIMQRMEFAEPMMNIGVVPRERLRRVGNTGEITLSMPVDKFPEMFGAPHLIIHRGDMQELFTAAVAPGTLRLGKRLVGLDDTGKAVTLAFADGSKVEADFVIAADGINSVVREQLFGPSPPTYSGTVAYRSIYPAKLLGGMKVPDHTKWWVGDKHLLIYFLTRARDEIYFVTGVPEDWGSDDFSPTQADMGKLQDIFSDFHEDVRKVIAAAPQASRWPILEREPFRPWSQGRVVLIGDACHAMRPHMGQGAAMAIEDAVVLSRCIVDLGTDDLARIFAAYEGARFDRTTAVHRGSQHNMWMKDSKEDPSWLYRYDALSVPLDAPAANKPAPQPVV